MRFLIRSGTLILAAVGIKSLYERYGKRPAGAEQAAAPAVLDTARAAARGVVDHAKFAAGEVAEHAKSAAGDVAADARARVDDVKEAAEPAKGTTTSAK